MIQIAGGILLALLILFVICVLLLAISEAAQSYHSRPKPPAPVVSKYPEGYQTIDQWMFTNKK